MADPFVAEIRMFPFNFAPKGWAFCDGQLLPISQNTALFSLCGTYYGGDGKSTFALPNLQGSTPLFWGQAQGGSLYDLGQMSGTEAVTLLDSEMPAHPHTFNAAVPVATLNQPNPTRALARSSGAAVYQTSNAGLVQMNFQTLGVAGSSFPHNNMMPYLTVNFCIALQGVFPPRG